MPCPWATATSPPGVQTQPRTDRPTEHDGRPAGQVSTDTQDARPHGGASTDTWRAYAAEHHGLSEDQAAEMSRDDLRGRYGS